MRFTPYGPFELPRETANMLKLGAADLRAFWHGVEDQVPGLPDACGCYVFSLRAPRGSKPWYVGKAEKTRFRRECISPHKALHYAQLVAKRKGVPELTLLAQVTENGKFRKPTKDKRPAISALESMLIGMAIARNSDLLNTKGTRMFSSLVVDGLLNSHKGKGGSSKFLRDMFSS